MDGRNSTPFITTEDLISLQRQHALQRYLWQFHAKRVLPMPKTNALRLTLCGLGLLTILAMDIAIPVLSFAAHWQRAVVCILAIVVTLETYGRYAGVKIVECYQHYAKEETRRRCLCVPSCSEYAILCLKRYELIAAILKIHKRLYVTCKGEKYVIDMP